MKWNEKCPGEEKCETEGEVFLNNTDLKTHCNPEKCKFFYTKTDSTPPEYRGFLQAALTFQENTKRKTETHESDFPFWAIWAYKANERAFELAEAEYNESRLKKPTDDSASIDNEGDSDVFGDIDAELGISKAKKESEV